MRDLPDGESSQDVVAAGAIIWKQMGKSSAHCCLCRRWCHLEIQVDILAKKLYLEVVLMELGLGSSSGRFEAEFGKEFQYLSDGQSGLAW